VEQTIIQLITQIGLPSALVLFFVYIGWKREERMTVRQNELEDFVRKDLADQLRKSTESQSANTAVLQDLSDALRQRPCLIKETKQ